MNKNKVERAAELLISELKKAKRMPIGTVSKGRKKVAEGKWVKVSDEKTSQKQPVKRQTSDKKNIYYQDFNDKKIGEATQYYKKNYGKVSGYDEKMSIANYVANGYLKLRDFLTTKNEKALTSEDIKNIKEYESLNKILEEKHKDLPFFTKQREKLSNKRFKELADIKKNLGLNIDSYFLSKYIGENKVKENIKLYRGIQGSGKSFFSSFNVGDEFEDPSFSSTSLLKLNRFSDDMFLEISVKANSNVANLNNDGEFEYLIDKGSKFRVIEKTKNNIKVELL